MEEQVNTKSVFLVTFSSTVFVIEYHIVPWKKQILANPYFVEIVTLHPLRSLKCIAEEFRLIKLLLRGIRFCSFSSYFCLAPSFIVFLSWYGLSACLMCSCISLNIHFNITIRSMRRFLCWQFFAKHVTYNLFDIKCQLNLHHTYWYKLADMASRKSQQRRRNVILSTKRRMKTPIVWINL